MNGPLLDSLVDRDFIIFVTLTLTTAGKTFSAREEKFGRYSKLGLDSLGACVAELRLNIKDKNSKEFLNIPCINYLELNQIF